MQVRGLVTWGCGQINHVKFSLPADQDKTASFELKLMDIDAEHLALPVRTLASSFCKGLGTKAQAIALGARARTRTVCS